MTRMNGHAGGRDTPLSLTRSLPARDMRVIRDVARFRQLSARQIGALHFWDCRSTTPLDRTLQRLTSSRHLARLERPRGGVGGGSAQYVYQLGRVGWRLLGNKPRDYWVPQSVNRHSLAVADCFVRLDQAACGGAFEVLDFQVEPACHVTVGSTQLTPDALMRLGFGERGSGEVLTYWLEIDRGTEHAGTIKGKCVCYWKAYQQWNPDDVYPLVLFVVPDVERARKIERVIAGGPDEAQALFQVSLQSEFPNNI